MDESEQEVIEQITVTLPFLDEEAPALYLADGRLYIPVYVVCQALGIRANIHPANPASIRYLPRPGFDHTADSWRLRRTKDAGNALRRRLERSGSDLYRKNLRPQNAQWGWLLLTAAHIT